VAYASAVTLSCIERRRDNIDYVAHTDSGKPDIAPSPFPQTGVAGLRDSLRGTPPPLARTGVRGARRTNR